MTDSVLFSSFDWASNTLQNRMVLAPMTRGRAGEDRIPNKIMGDHYVQRADAGLIITEATAISEEGIGWVDTPGIYTDDMVEGWRSIVNRVHEAGGKIVLQLWHTGRASHSDFHNGDLPLSASAIKIEGDEIHTPKGKKPYEVPKAMSLHDIKRTVEDYKKAAMNAKANTAMNRTDFEQALRAKGQYYHIHHPYHKAMYGGQCTPEQIRG